MGNYFAVYDIDNKNLTKKHRKQKKDISDLKPVAKIWRIYPAGERKGKKRKS
jgi:hypothetical protein